MVRVWRSRNTVPMVPRPVVSCHDMQHAIRSYRPRRLGPRPRLPYSEPRVVRRHASRRPRRATHLAGPARAAAQPLHGHRTAPGAESGGGRRWRFRPCPRCRPRVRRQCHHRLQRSASLAGPTAWRRGAGSQPRLQRHPQYRPPCCRPRRRDVDRGSDPSAGSHRGPDCRGDREPPDRADASRRRRPHHLRQWAGACRSSGSLPCAIGTACRCWSTAPTLRVRSTSISPQSAPIGMSAIAINGCAHRKAAPSCTRRGPMVCIPAPSRMVTAKGSWRSSTGPARPTLAGSLP